MPLIRYGFHFLPLQFSNKKYRWGSWRGEALDWYTLWSVFKLKSRLLYFNLTSLLLSIICYLCILPYPPSVNPINASSNNTPPPPLLPLQVFPVSHSELATAIPTGLFLLLVFVKHWCGLARLTRPANNTGCQTSIAFCQNFRNNVQFGQPKHFNYCKYFKSQNPTIYKYRLSYIKTFFPCISSVNVTV